MEIRETKIERYKKIWLSRESHEYLRELKRESKKGNGEGKSMTEILDNLINKHKERI